MLFMHQRCTDAAFEAQASLQTRGVMHLAERGVGKEVRAVRKQDQASGDEPHRRSADHGWIKACSKFVQKGADHVSLAFGNGPRVVAGL